MTKQVGGWLKGLLQSDKGVRILLVCGIAGMILIFLSGLGGKSRESPAPKAANEETATAYETNLEQRLASLVGSIEGCGRTQVLVTVEGGGRSIYANEQKNETVTEQESGSAGRERTNELYENEYVLIKNADGSESALVAARLQPEIKGVAVLCDGGEDTVVQQRIIDAVTTVLNISSSCVCVTKMSE